MTSFEPPASDQCQARRRLRVRLLRDLVSQGLYHVPVDLLADRLLQVPELRPRG